MHLQGCQFLHNDQCPQPIGCYLLLMGCQIQETVRNHGIREEKSPACAQIQGKQSKQLWGKRGVCKTFYSILYFFNYFVKTYTIIFNICELKEKYFTILVRKPNKLIKLLLSFSKIPSVLWLPWKHYFLFALGGVRTAFLAALTVSIQVLYSRIPWTPCEPVLILHKSPTIVQ